MTSLTSVPASSSSTVDPPDSHKKSMLFCPACGHESTTDGDWVVDDDSTYRCPECRTVIGDRRPDR